MKKSEKDLTIPTQPALGVEHKILEESKEDSIDMDMEERLGFLKESNNDNFLRSIRVLTKDQLNKEVKLDEESPKTI